MCFDLKKGTASFSVNCGPYSMTVSTEGELTASMQFASNKQQR